LDPQQLKKYEDSKHIGHHDDPRNKNKSPAGASAGVSQRLRFLRDGCGYYLFLLCFDSINMYVLLIVGFKNLGMLAYVGVFLVVIPAAFFHFRSAFKDDKVKGKNNKQWWKARAE
jgi:hypothetical protein